MSSTLQTSTGSRPLAGKPHQVATRAVFLLAGTAVAVWAPLVPYAKSRLGVGDGAFGLLLLCLGLGSILAMPVTGILTGRFGCRAVIVGAAATIALALPFLVLADTGPGLAVALAVFGAGVGTVDVAINVQAVMVERDGGRSMMSGFHGLFSLGGIVGAGGTSLLLGAGLAPLHATLVGAALLVGLMVVSYAGLLPYGSDDGEPSPLLVAPKGVVILLGLLCFIVFLAEGAMLDWSALFMIAEQGSDAARAGLGYTAFAVAMTTGRLGGDRIVERLGGTRIVVFGGNLAAAGFLLAVFAPGPIAALFGFALIGLGASNIVPVFYTAAGRQTHMPAGLAIAAVTTLGYAGILLGPAAIGLVAQARSLSTAFALLAAALVFVAAVGPLAARR